MTLIFMSLHIFHAFVCLLSGLDQPAFAEAEETGVLGMFREADDEVILEPKAEQAARFMQAPG